MDLTIRPLRENELPAADRIFRLAFGTFIGLPDPLTFTGDCAYVRTRWLADPAGAFAAVGDGAVVGSNFATRWGSFAFFGPLSVHPELWDRGVAKQLLDATMARFAEWQVAHAGLFTFPDSPKHLGLYQRHGFHPRFLTTVLQKPVGAAPAPHPAERFSALPVHQRADALAACRRLTSAIFDGLDVAHEIRAVQEQALGDTVLQWDGSELAAFAVCHVGAGSEAGSGTCYVKFGAARPGVNAAAAFARLLDATERFAAERGAGVLVIGVNTAREAAYRALLARGFRIFIQGVAMQRPNEQGFNRPDVFVVDDWR